MTIPSGMRPLFKRTPASVEDGGTGERTAKEAAAALGVPTLGGNNVFTGVNEFEALTQIRGGLELTTDSLNVVNSGNHIVSLDFSQSGGGNYVIPASEGTFAMSGDPLRVPYNAQGSSYAASDNDCVISATGTVTVTLPTAVGVSGRMYWVKNSGTGTITVDGNGSETIDGAATQAVAAGDCIQVCSDGLNWIIL